MLRQTNKGVAESNLLMNVCIALRHAPEWQGVLARNLLTGNVDLLCAPPYGKSFLQARPLDNLDISRTKIWLEEKHVDATADTVLRAIKVVASDNAYHPIRAMLTGLPWNGTVLDGAGEPALDTSISGTSASRTRP